MAARYSRVRSTGEYAMKVGDHTWWLTAAPYPRWVQTGYSMYMRCFDRVHFDPLERFKRDLREAHDEGQTLDEVYAKYKLTR